ncbi:MAG: APC family permease [Chloroflexota bacterium]
MSLDPDHRQGPVDEEQGEQMVLPHERRSLEYVRPTRPGNTSVRVSYPRFRGFLRRHGHLEASAELEQPHGPLGRLRRALVGSPIPTERETQERLTKKKALAVFSSDALSSVAYTPQETLLILLAAGTGAIWWSLPIAIAVVALLAIVVTSYRQTIYAYPSGGGSYIVARQNLGQLPGLLAASALVLGYVLTVSVSIASAVDQLVSAAPALLPLRVYLAVAAVAFVTVVNLRGVRESGTIFALPTYVFLASMYSLIGIGLYLLFTNQLVVPAPSAEAKALVGSEQVTLLLLLRAFAVGSAVMTGTEAISNGIPAFQPPEPRNAARTLLGMGTILAVMFLGLGVLIVGTGVIPSPDQTLISLLARGVFGNTVFYYVIQGAAVLILILAANTAYADFPRLSSLLARDDYAPHQLAFRGERLAFTNGIILLGVLSALLIVMFGGSTGALLPLYAVSVFAAFTFSQAGMVRHWYTERSDGWRLKAAVNAVGATMTGLVTFFAASTNFMNRDLPLVDWLPVGYGSWLVFLIVPFFVWLFLLVHGHYQKAERAVSLDTPADTEKPLRNVVVVPISRLNQPTLEALRYARSLSANVTAVHVAFDPERAREIEAAWGQWSKHVPLAIIESPYRSLTGPLLSYITELKRVEAADVVTVVLPEYVPNAWWEHLLHGQSAQFLKLALYFKPGFVVTSVPYHENA